MTKDQEQSFDTGPTMLNPIFAFALLVACGALAVSQWWVATQRWADQGAMTGEPVARILFAAVFTAAAFGIGFALLERVNAAVILGDRAVTIRSWRGEKQAIPWEEVTSVALVTPAGDQPDLPFHWLSIDTSDGRTLRLAGGPWPETVEVRDLRRKLTARLPLRRRDATSTRWLLLLPAERVTWS